MPKSPVEKALVKVRQCLVKMEAVERERAIYHRNRENARMQAYCDGLAHGFKLPIQMVNHAIRNSKVPVA